MSLLVAVCAVLVVGVGALAARAKARQRDQERIALLRAGPRETRPTHFSQGVVDLVAVAGGIYLSLVLVAGFAGYDLPDRVPVPGGYLDPLAVMALLLAVVEPFLSRLFEKQG